MIRFLLDTNVVIDLGRQRNIVLMSRVSGTSTDELAISSISLGELYYGEQRVGVPSRSLLALNSFLAPVAVLPFGHREASFYGLVRADLERKGMTIGAHDLMIAATALAHDITLVTRDTSDFSRVQDLRIEDWSVES